MIASAAFFKGHLCFKGDWSGFDQIRPINVVIGRNNSGKSQLLDLVDSLCTGTASRDQRTWSRKYRGVLDEESCRRVFGNKYYTNKFSGISVSWEVDAQQDPAGIDTEPALEDIYRTVHIGVSPSLIERTKAKTGRILRDASHPISDTFFRRLVADRDIRPEKAMSKDVLQPNGDGASNLVRRFIVSSNPKLPREVIQSDLRNALNEIFAQDGHFEEIQILYHEEQAKESEGGDWEIFLGEAEKGLVPLSQSGSGLKTVLLVLLNLIAVPIVEGRDRSQFTFAFEELENNLHPALLRRLFQFIESYAVQSDASVFLTTHSSTALDFFGVSKNAQIVHVIHDGISARTMTDKGYFHRISIISELGARPSDLLQANGIVWVEGPSDRIYINHWISLQTEGLLQEGRDYQCAFYGGTLLARTQFSAPEQEKPDLVNLLQINPNVVVVCDSDRTSKHTLLKDRVRRIRDEVDRLPRAHMWITDPTEIENYIPGEVIRSVVNPHSMALRSPERYQPFYPRSRVRRKSYVEQALKRQSVDKVDFAIAIVPRMTRRHMAGRFDWEHQMTRIVDCIRSWIR